jgi:hypothetical protein
VEERVGCDSEARASGCEVGRFASERRSERNDSLSSCIPDDHRDLSVDHASDPCRDLVHISLDTHHSEISAPLRLPRYTNPSLTSLCALF